MLKADPVYGTALELVQAFKEEFHSGLRNLDLLTRISRHDILLQASNIVKLENQTHKNNIIELRKFPLADSIEVHLKQYQDKIKLNERILKEINARLPKNLKQPEESEQTWGCTIF